jgi:transcriptional regulator with XRE-family HTH domain
MPRAVQNKADIVVGRNIRIIRQKLRMSQSALARVTFQQIQKYEKGLNLVGASRLAQIAAALRVPIPSLFQGVGENNDFDSPHDLLTDANAIKLAEAFAEVRDSQMRRTIVALVTQMAHKIKFGAKSRSSR